MQTIDLYGRNPDFQRTTFAYPYPLVSDTLPAPGKRFFFKPPQSNPVFGVDFSYSPDADDNVALLDPTNTRYTSAVSRGGLSGYDGYSPFDEMNSMQGLAGVTPMRLGSGLASDIGLGEDAPNLWKRAKGSFVQDPKVREAKIGAARDGAWGAWDGLGSFYRRSSGTAQVAMLVVGGLIAYNLFGGRGR